MDHYAAIEASPVAAIAKSVASGMNWVACELYNDETCLSDGASHLQDVGFLWSVISSEEFILSTFFPRDQRRREAVTLDVRTGFGMSWIRIGF